MVKKSAKYGLAALVISAAISAPFFVERIAANREKKELEDYIQFASQVKMISQDNTVINGQPFLDNVQIDYELKEGEQVILKLLPDGAFVFTGSKNSESYKLKGFVEKQDVLEYVSSFY